jgi:hypothetical protein
MFPQGRFKKVIMLIQKAVSYFLYAATPSKLRIYRCLLYMNAVVIYDLKLLFAFCIKISEKKVFVGNFWQLYTKLPGYLVFFNLIIERTRGNMYFSDSEVSMFTEVFTSSSISLAFFEIFHEVGNELRYRVLDDIIIFTVAIAPLIFIKYVYHKCYFWFWHKLFTHRLSIEATWIVVFFKELFKVLLLAFGIHVAIGSFWFFSFSLSGIPFAITQPPFIQLEQFWLWLFEGGAHVTRFPFLSIVAILGTALEYSFLYLVAMLLFYLFYRLYRHAFKKVYFGNTLTFSWRNWLGDTFTCMLFMLAMYEYDQYYVLSMHRRAIWNIRWPKRYYRKEFFLEQGRTDEMWQRFDLYRNQEWHERLRIIRDRRIRRLKLRRIFRTAYHYDSTLWHIAGARHFRRRMRKRRRRKKRFRRRWWLYDMDWEIYDDMPVLVDDGT